jgi:hypothetical protein
MTIETIYLQFAEIQLRHWLVAGDLIADGNIHKRGVICKRMVDQSGATISDLSKGLEHAHK